MPFSSPSPARRVGVTGATGLVGSALLPALRARGYIPVPFVRQAPAAGEIGWRPEPGGVDPASLEGLHALIHLAGASVAQRWSAETKTQIRQSRIFGTQALTQAILACPTPPKVLICASAAGFYGPQAREVDERSPPGEDFLAHVGQAWEQAARPAAKAGTRVVFARFGTLLSARGGALPRLARLTRFGLGGRIGAGTQGWPWLHLDDAVASLLFALEQPDLTDAFNATSPNPCTQREASRTLARVLGTWVSPPAPAWAVRLTMGEMADALLLGGALVHPRVLSTHGFTWRYPELPQALSAELFLRGADHGT